MKIQPPWDVHTSLTSYCCLTAVWVVNQPSTKDWKKSDISSCNGPLRKAFSAFESFLLSLSLNPLAGRKISRCPQHASLSLVKVRDYIIIHPTQEAEEDRWAGEVISTSLHRHCLSIYVSLGTEKFRIGRAVHISMYAQGQMCGLLFYMAATAIFSFLGLL